ncbi:B-cell antigen receptor complex-associated protein beta chain [Melanotaenia boesemani]|uniref:B-cell antigen receptor complex-associated protein beta chain n=1 Tax=Melanotaenia boesemani TaxID=1250792 RepID=UPI001C04E54A|nr:B-cell antigen receptor complex-associated protein beta chain [Melanotaenia boesemani]
MRWILAGCCGLALITLTVSLQVSQRPRFIGLKTKRVVRIYCSSKQNVQSTALWYKADEYKGSKHRIYQTERIVFHNSSMIQNGILNVLDIQVEDSGVYFCEVNGAEGPGTEVQAVRGIILQQALYRSKMKDGLIILQGLLLAACIGAILLRKQRLMERRDSIYEEPETDHIYEGLAIESCGGDLYEDLSVYAQAEGTEAPWE